MSASARIAVLDTNIVLDLFLFADPRTALLRAELEAGQLQWHATAHMRNELERVLAYAHIQALLLARGRQAQEVLRDFDHGATLVPPPIEKAAYTCKDTDDQVFIDLACSLAQSQPASTVLLLSKDKAVLSMRKRLEKLSVLVKATLSG
jgi:predicted nucleic acid-binding protein